MITPIYQVIKEKLEAYILEHNITGKLPGTRQLSKEFGCHHVTLSKAIHLLEMQGVLEIRGNLGIFVRNRTKPPRPIHRILALVDSQMEKPAGRKILTDMNLRLKSSGYSMIGINFDYFTFQENPRLLLNFPVDGFLFKSSTLLPAQMELLEKEGIPLVSCSRQFGSDMIDQIDCDHGTGYRVMLQKLMAQGHRRIAWIEYGRVPAYQPYLNFIKECFKSTLGEFFLPELLYIRETAKEAFEHYGENYCRMYIKNALRHFSNLPQQPTAIITAANVLCEELCQYLAEKNIKIPEDVTVMCVNHGSQPKVIVENIPVTYYDGSKMLLWGLDRLLQRLANRELKPETKLVAPEFINWDEEK